MSTADRTRLTVALLLGVALAGCEPVRDSILIRGAIVVDGSGGPGIYSETAEVLALARVAAEHGGRYISHIRSEDRYFWDAVEEIIQIGREARIRSRSRT